jgi:hypothetical protein
MAALAVWNYSLASARWIWGDALGDPIADDLLSLLRTHPDGHTATEIRDYFGRHRSGDIDRAGKMLLENNLAHFVTERTKGRSVRRWFARSSTEAPKGDEP